MSYTERKIKKQNEKMILSEKYRYSDEKKLQNKLKEQLEFFTGKSIQDEEILLTDNSIDIIKEIRQNHNKYYGGYILIDKLKENISKINYSKIKKLSETLDKKEEFIIDRILNDFLTKFNLIISSTSYLKNIQLYNLYFNKKQELSFYIDKELVEYNVLQLELSKAHTNEITIIKEKILLVQNTHQRPDFAIYMNGLPFIALEMKRGVKDGIDGTQSAYNSYKYINNSKSDESKESYYNFLACVGTNGIDAFISTAPGANDYYLWANYEHDEMYESRYKNEFTNIGLYDISKELLTNPLKLLFYFKICVMEVNEDTNYLKNARVQQYFTGLKFNDEFKIIHQNRNLNVFNVLKKHFQHPTRTGKSFSFKILTNLLSTEYKNLFKKIMFFTHDKSSVLESVKKEFGDWKFPSSGKTIQQIGGKGNLKYKDMIEASNYGLYIVNMQQIKKEKFQYLGHDVLILIDEVHTHQKETEGFKISDNFDDLTGAEIRKKHFPNASIISATATTIKKEIKDSEGNIYYEDMTSHIFGECIDRMTPSDAKRLKLITDLRYNQPKYAFDIESDEHREFIKQMIDIENYYKNNIFNKIKTESSDNIKAKILSYFKYTLDENDLNKFNEFELYFDEFNIEEKENLIENSTRNYSKKLKNHIVEYINQFIIQFNNNYEQIKKEVDLKIWENQLKMKIKDIVVPEIKKEQNVYSFNPKYFYVVPSQINYGKRMLEILKEMIQEEIDNGSNEFNDIKNNIYKGIRFGFDNEGNQEINELNGDLRTNSEGNPSPTKTFQSMDYDSPIKPIDVLILVRKKLMGFDEKNLSITFLDRKIQSISVMMQLSTRAITKRTGKTMGTLFDLTVDQTNVNTFKKCFEVYDQSELENFIMDQNEINNTIKELQRNIIQIKHNFVGMNSNIIFNDLIQNKHELYAETLIQNYWKGKKENSREEVFKDTYFSQFKELSKIYKSLRIPTIILPEQENGELLNQEIFALYHINKELLSDIKNKELILSKSINYTEDEIIELIESSFSVFENGINDFERLTQLSFKGIKEVRTGISRDKNSKKSEILSIQINQLIKRIENSNIKVKGGITEKLALLIQELNVFNDEDDDTSINDNLNELLSMMEEEENLFDEINQKYFNNNIKTIMYFELKDFFFKNDNYEKILINYINIKYSEIYKMLNSLDEKLSLVNKLKKLTNVNEFNLTTITGLKDTLTEKEWQDFRTLWSESLKKDLTNLHETVHIINDNPTDILSYMFKQIVKEYESN